MDTSKKRQLYIIGGIVLAVFVVVVVLLIALGGNGSKEYDKHYNAAENAFLKQDYDAALKELDKAMKVDATEDCYLLMADVYYAQGDKDMAIQVLYLGYSHVGSSAIADMLEILKAGSGGSSEIGSGDSIEVCGEPIAIDAVSAGFSGKSLSDADIKALGTLTALESLSISGCGVRDIAPLANLTNLTSLQISDNHITDLAALSGLAKLKALYIDRNEIVDFTPLYALSNLRTLSMKDVSITAKELDTLKKELPNCSILADASGDEVEEINLGGKTFTTDVTELNLGGLGLRDISELSKCTKLVKLDLRDNKITDISPLVDLQDLEWLCLWNNKVEDIMPLLTLEKLTYLDADTNRITDISVLEYLPNLEELWISNNGIRNFSVLEKLLGLHRLGLKNTGICDKDLEYLYALPELKELTLEENGDLTANAVDALQETLPRCSIAHDMLLWTVTLDGKTYTSDCTEIIASGRGIRDLTGLEHFTELETLDLDNNDIADLSPLYELTGLKTLYLRGNDLAVEEIEALQAKLPGCRILSDIPFEEEDDTGPDSDPMYISIGSTAAINVAGTGSGYGIFWCTDDPVAAGVRTGFISQAKRLSMNVVFDCDYEADCTDFRPYLEQAQDAGADLLIFAGDDETLYLVLEQAEELDYDPFFVQVYME